MRAPSSVLRPAPGVGLEPTSRGLRSALLVPVELPGLWASPSLIGGSVQVVDHHASTIEQHGVTTLGLVFPLDNRRP